MGKAWIAECSPVPYEDRHAKNDEILRQSFFFSN